MANELITLAAKRKMSRALAEGAPPPRVTGMAVGDGGVDTNRNPVTPEPQAAALKHQAALLDIGVPVYLNDEKTTARYTAVLPPGMLAGVDINELGLVDADGDLLCIKTFADKRKDADMEMELSVDVAF